MRQVLSIGILAALTACQAVPPQSNVNTPEARGYKLAVNRCADCHSVTFAETSPLPQAPAFSAIANMPGLTPATLAQWMRDHGNYPDEMYFEIPAEHIEELTAYILTLRRQEADRPG